MKKKLLWLLVPGSLLLIAAAGPLSQWTSIDSIADGDFFALTDISDTTDSANGTSKKATGTQLKTYVDTGFISESEMTTHEGAVDPHTVYVLESAAGSAHTRNAEDTLTNAGNLPDGAAIIAYLVANYQPFDADLGTYAGITPSANVQSVLGAADYAAIKTLLNLVIGTDVQAYDADLTTYAGITPAANIQSLLGAATYQAFLDLILANATFGPLQFEGATADEHETSFSITDPTADRTIATLDANMRIPAATVVNADGSIALADEATVLETARTIGGVSFDGSANIDLPGVNTSGTQDTSGTAAEADALSTTGRAATETYTNKTIDADDNTLQDVPYDFCVAASDETTDLTTGTAKRTFRVPRAITLTEVRASVATAPVGSTLDVDVNEGGVSIFSTVLTIDASEKTSETAATAAVISDSALADDGEMTIDIDQIGSSTAGAGLKVCFIGKVTY